jgi:hypothetical protein
MAEISIETALVHIHSLADPENFIGCGAIVEGGYIATCRHVWRKAGGRRAKVTWSTAP